MTAPIDWEFQLGQIYFNTRGQPDDLGCLWAMALPDGWDSPPVRLTTTDIPFADGSDVPDTYYSARIIHGTGLVVAPNVNMLEAAKRRLKAETRFLTVDGQFIEKPLDGAFVRGCTVRRLGPTVFPQRNGPESTTFDFQLVAGDPLKYAIVPQVVVVQSSTQVGGLGFPWTFPLTFASDADVTSATQTSTNEGDVDAPFVVDFNGPLTNPSLIDRATQQRIDLTANIAAGRTITVDTRAQTVVIDGSSIEDAYADSSTPLSQLAIRAESDADWLLLGSGTGNATVMLWSAAE